METFKFSLGDPVQKVLGYSMPGVIVACYHTLDGQARYVLECTVPECKGMQHIFNGGQLMIRELHK